MEISAIQLGRVVVVKIVGNLDGLTAEKASTFFSSQVREGAIRLVTDFSEVEYVSSAGLRVLLATVKAVRLVGGDLRLAALREAVMPVLELSGFSTMLQVYPSIEQAIGSFAA